MIRNALLTLCLATVTFLSTVIVYSPVFAQDDEIYVLSTAWSPDGAMIAAVGTGGFFQIWNITTGNVAAEFTEVNTTQYPVAWSPDSQRLAIAGEDRLIKIWEVASGQLLATLDGHNDTILALAWSPDGQVLASGSQWDGAVILWDMTTYQSIRGARVGDTYSLAWSPDGTRLAMAGFPGIRILPSNLEVEQPLVQYSLIRAIEIGSVAWNSDGSRIAAVDKRGNLYIYDMTTHQQLAMVSAHEGWAYSVAWSPDDQYIVSYGVDGQVKVWDAATTQLVSTYSGNEGKVAFTLGFSPYGGRLAYGGSLSSGEAAALDTSEPSTERVARSLGNGAVQIVVPAPSLERLQAIADACNAPAAVEQSLTASLQADQLSSFIAQVEALPENTIPPACAADLIAVAEALQSR